MYRVEKVTITESRGCQMYLDRSGQGATERSDAD